MHWLQRLKRQKSPLRRVRKYAPMLERLEDRWVPSTLPGFEANVSNLGGYQGETFASAREFLDWLPRNQAACLVLDIHMNDMNGFDLQERLAVPIIFITAHDDVPTLEHIEKSGAAGHLRKPFDAATVLKAIRRAVRATHAQTSGVDGDGHVHDA